MNANDEKRLLEAADRSEITQVLHSYTENLDRRDLEGAKVKCFHPDAHCQYTDAGPAQSLDEFFSTSGSLVLTFKQTMHYLMNTSIRLDGDKAKVQTYLFAHNIIPEDFKEIPPLFPNMGEDYAVVIGGRYVDDFERRDGQWKIAFRKLYFEWESKIPTSVISGPYTQEPGVVIPSIFKKS